MIISLEEFVRTPVISILSYEKIGLKFDKWNYLEPLFFGESKKKKNLDMFRICKSIIYHEIVHSVLRILKAEVIISTGFLSWDQCKILSIN